MCYIIKQMKKKEICFEVNLFTNTYCTLDIIDDLFNFIVTRSDEFLENFNISYRNICKNKTTYNSPFIKSNSGKDIDSIQRITHYYTENRIADKDKRRIISLSFKNQLNKLLALKKSLGTL